jgi:hypothetical protein
MTLTVKLADEEQNRLDVIVAATHSTNQSEAVRALINEKYEALQASLTLTQRRGGHPKHLMNGSGNMSERKNRKGAIDQILAKKSARRAK